MGLFLLGTSLSDEPPSLLDPMPRRSGHGTLSNSSKHGLEEPMLIRVILEPVLYLVFPFTALFLFGTSLSDEPPSLLDPM
jgi:hypothetical protein